MASGAQRAAYGCLPNALPGPAVGGPQLAESFAKVCRRMCPSLPKALPLTALGVPQLSEGLAADCLRLGGGGL